MRKPNRTLLISAGVTALALGLSVTAAHAASAGSSHPASSTRTWSVSTTGFEEPDNVGPTVLADPSTGGKITCGDVVSVAKPASGMFLRRTLVSFTTMDFGNCTLPDGTSVAMGPVKLPWTLTGERFDSSRNLGVTTGRVHNVSLSFSSSSCSGTVDGTAAGANDGGITFQYYNNPHWFIFRIRNSTLHAYGLSGCSGIFNNGDQLTLHFTLAALALVITSP